MWNISGIKLNIWTTWNQLLSIILGAREEFYSDDIRANIAAYPLL